MGALGGGQGPLQAMQQEAFWVESGGPFPEDPAESEGWRLRVVAWGESKGGLSESAAPSFLPGSQHCCLNPAETLLEMSPPIPASDFQE